MTRTKGSGEVMLAVAATAPTLVWRLGITYLRMKRRARRSGSEFYRSLVANGVPQIEARELANEFESAISLRRIVGQLSSRRWV
jgi:arginyl-tRNA--protein-N-Asp/Glu arginylyltransferase